MRAASTCASPGVTLRSYPGRRATIKGGQVRISPNGDQSEAERSCAS